jgi:hypothetical protein
MDKRSSKDQMLKQIAHLTYKLERVYEIGQEGISYVGAANSAEREQRAARNLGAAFYDEIYTDT